MACSGEASFTQKLRLFTKFSWSENTTGLKSWFFPSSPSPPSKKMIFLESFVSRHAHVQQTPQPDGFWPTQPPWGEPSPRPACWATLLQQVHLAALGVCSEETYPLPRQSGLIQGMASGQLICPERSLPLHWQQWLWTSSSCCFSGMWFCSVQNKNMEMLNNDYSCGVRCEHSRQETVWWGWGLGLYIYVKLYIYWFLYIYIILMRRGIPLFWSGGSWSCFQAAPQGLVEKSWVGARE